MAVRVEVAVAVGVDVRVTDDVSVGMGVCVDVRVAVAVWVTVAVLVKLGVRVLVAVREGVPVRVEVPVLVGVRVRLPVGPGVPVCVGEGEGVGDGVDDPVGVVVGEFCTVDAVGVGVEGPGVNCASTSADTSALVTRPSPFTSTPAQALPLKIASMTADTSTTPSQLPPLGMGSATAGVVDKHAHRRTTRNRSRRTDSASVRGSATQRIPTPQAGSHASPRTALQHGCTTDAVASLRVNFTSRSISGRGSARETPGGRLEAGPFTVPALAEAASA